MWSYTFRIFFYVQMKFCFSSGILDRSASAVPSSTSQKQFAEKEAKTETVAEEESKSVAVPYLQAEQHSCNVFFFIGLCFAVF